MTIPLIGRLSLFDWPIIIISFVLAWAEIIVTNITAVLPSTFISLFTWVTGNIFSLTSNAIDIKREEAAGEDDQAKFHYLKSKDISSSGFSKEKFNKMIEMLNARDIQEMAKIHGYDIEIQVLTTKDNYLLTVHRIKGKRERRPNGKVVYLHHGLLMCSEIWVTMLEKYQNLPFILYELGYDVWLGNNRGNKYSQKHLFYELNTTKYWNFSIDEFALFDIPDTIDYILKATKKQKLTYIGFSQGSAQAFASISVNAELNDKIDQMIAISPATTPHGLYSKFLDVLLKSSPNITYLLFSRKVLMPSCLFWQKIMYPPLFNFMIDFSNYMLFNWKAYNITKLQKLASYAHLYSTTSTKCVVHWFQVMQAKNFQMYHDSSFLSGLNPISYPLKNIKIPISLVYGDADSLVDIDVMKSQLPKSTRTHAVKDYEHLDLLWGDDAFSVTFKQVLRYLKEDVDDVYSRLFRNDPNGKLIEDIVARVDGGGADGGGEAGADGADGDGDAADFIDGGDNNGDAGKTNDLHFKSSGNNKATEDEYNNPNRSYLKMLNGQRKGQRQRSSFGSSGSFEYEPSPSISGSGSFGALR